MNILAFLKTINNLVSRIVYPLKAHWFWLRIRSYKRLKKIVYTITPPPNLRNIGDHAQVLGIQQWIRDNFQGYTLIEFDKNEIYKYFPVIKKIIAPDDLVFLHSGGNMGDNGLWSEYARRMIIAQLPNNKIISLPQTISFSASEKGERELRVSRELYNSHGDLTIIARDKISFSLARDYFYACHLLLCPDFVLYLDPSAETCEPRTKALLCLRKDNESILKEEDFEKIKASCRDEDFAYEEFDTTISQDIPKDKRRDLFHETVEYFTKFRLVITDRFHGLIFAYLSATPCIVLPTINHKMYGGIQWLQQLQSISFVSDLRNIPEIIREVLKEDASLRIDWRNIYFNPLKQKILNYSYRETNYNESNFFLTESTQDTKNY